MNINMTLDDTLLHAGLIYRCTHCFDAVKEEPASCHLCRFFSAKCRRPHIFTLQQCIIYGSSTYGQKTLLFHINTDPLHHSYENVLKPHAWIVQFFHFSIKCN